VLRCSPDITKARLVISAHDPGDRMILLVGGDAPGLSSEILKQTLREVTKLRGEVEFVVRDSLPVDGKLIDDQRTATVRC
jgi:phenylacetate-CoA ligase